MQHEAQRTRTYTWQAPLMSWQALHKQDGLSFLRAMLAGEIGLPPMASTMNFSLLEAEAGRVVYGCEPAEYHYNPIASVHGGVAASLFDTALSAAVHSQLPAGFASRTTMTSIIYLRALTKDTGRIRCEATALHVGRTMATASAQLVGEADGRLYGHATSVQVIAPAPTGALDLPQASDTRTFTWQDPLISASQGARLAGFDYIQAMADGTIPVPPIGTLVGMTGIHEIRPGQVRFGTGIGGWQLNSLGAIHGGVASTVLDSAMGCAIHTTLPLGMAYTTAELNTRYIRPVSLNMSRLYADGMVIHSGPDTAVAEGRLVDDAGELYAYGSTTCLVFPLPKRG